VTALHSKICLASTRFSLTQSTPSLHLTVPLLFLPTLPACPPHLQLAAVNSTLAAAAIPPAEHKPPMDLRILQW
jgi:hypothetical protein